MYSPTGRSRILQIHPTRRCNLRCLHCYSRSGPEQRQQLDQTLLEGAIADASAFGYDVVSFSGGEPLVYRPLVNLLDAAHKLGMTTTITTNGMLLDRKRQQELLGRVDLLAISLDGVPESHNRMRAEPKAFAKMAAQLPSLRESGIPFGFIFTLTQFNLHELPWVAQFAAEQGAKLLQIHPLEEVGRAFHQLDGNRPDRIEAEYAFLTAAKLDEAYGDRMRVQLDFVSRKMLLEDPQRFFADNEGVPVGLDRPLAELVSPLIIEPDGWVLPLQYGFDRRYALGNLHERRLCEAGETWVRKICPAFYDLCRSIHQELTATDQPLVNWYGAARSVHEQYV